MTDQVEYTIEDKIGNRVARARFTIAGREKNVIEDLTELLESGTLPPDVIEVDEDEDEVDVPDTTVPKALMAVDRVEGSRGQEVLVHIRGGAPDPIMGFQFAMGYGRWLEVLEIDVGDFFKAYAGEHIFASAENVVGGWPEPFVRVAVAFFNIDPSAPKGIGGIKEPIPIPPGTVLATVRFKIPDAPGNMEQTLFMKRLWFKEKSTDHSLLKVDCMYPAMRKRGGHIPVTVSGKVTVREGAVEDPAAAIAAPPAERPATAEAPAAAPAPVPDMPAKPPHVTP